MNLLTVGIDPGLTGAVAILDQSNQVVALADLPIIRDLSLAWVDGPALHSIILTALDGRGAGAVVERVSSMPGQGIASAFKFGVGFGSVLSVLQVMRLPITLVSPAVWKRAHGLGKDKHASLHKARLQYPTAELRLAKHHGRAEALLIARYALNLMRGSHEA
jgi:hypothetical protein